MVEKKPCLLDVLIEAYEKSHGEFVDLVVDHGELRGITAEMMKWFQFAVNSPNPAYYKMWHPQDHVSHKKVTQPGEGKEPVCILLMEERIGEFGASVLRCRQEDPDSFPFPKVYKNCDGGTILGPSDIPLGLVYHESEETPDGMRMRSIFRFPAKTPERFLEAMHEHSKTETENFLKFLPALYAKESHLNPEDKG